MTPAQLNLTSSGTILTNEAKVLVDNRRTDSSGSLIRPSIGTIRKRMYGKAFKSRTFMMSTILSCDQRKGRLRYMTSTAPCLDAVRFASPISGTTSSMTRFMLSGVITSQIAAKHNDEHLLIAVKLLCKAVIIENSSSMISG